MKAKMIFKITIPFFLICIFCSCKKKDYRDDYIGSFQFNTNIRIFITDSTFSDTTIMYFGEINYGKSDNDLAIHYLTNNTIFPILETNGNLKSPSNSGLGVVFGGKFETLDIVKFSSTSGPGGQGTLSHIADGIRQ